MFQLVMTVYCDSCHTGSWRRLVAVVVLVGMHSILWCWLHAAPSQLHGPSTTVRRIGLWNWRQWTRWST